MSVTNVKIKICGIGDEAALAAARDAGADFLGFVFYPRSPRAVTPDAAAMLMRDAGAHAKKVGLFVDPTDDELRRTLALAPLDMIQLHGGESVSRVADVRARFGLPVIKALRIAARDDLMPVDSYARMADWILFDARVDNAALPGGMGRRFDWSVLDGFRCARPWMLAGGLDAENVVNALARLKPDAVDVSSGVESAPGVKDAGKIRAFVDKVRGC
ncbi:MAG: phosphoribosylanthranilate isomerase [Rhodospirillales bacterium]|nr:phosphoribosylanthranilate isomerase [Alphaproteobacteria bacterium]MCB9986698.1 phosphoribosylanthranilate isomerase [Rhodospirillales bacterium]USO06777.1 MAG: phosphoribosylanthranilate isomerase [Rhodospirillales bacterium]